MDIDNQWSDYYAKQLCNKDYTKRKQPMQPTKQLWHNSIGGFDQVQTYLLWPDHP